MSIVQQDAQKRNTKQENPLLIAALARTQEGWAVHPLWGIITRGGVRQCECSAGIRCEKPGKHGRLTGWQDAATHSPKQIQSWWKLYPHANIGAHTGKKSGRNVLDTDPQNGGAISREALESEHGTLPDTQQTITGGGGLHDHFLYDGPLKNSVGALGAGLDIRSDGGNLVLPGSLHISGGTYEYEVTHGPEDVPLAEMPAWLRAKLSAQSNGHHKPTAEGEPINNGQRNDTLFKLACSMRNRGCSHATILSALHTENEARCTPPLDENELEKIATSGSKYEPGTSRVTEQRLHEVTVPPTPIVDNETATTTVWACPESLRIGVFETVSEKLGKWSWEVFQGVFGALSARASRNIHCHYFSDHIHGNGFSLLVNATGTGKNLVVNIGRALLGKDYKIRTGLNSGPALMPMLTDDELKSKGGRLEVRGTPVALFSSEWSRIAQMSGIEHATLMEDLNDLHMRHHPWSQSRSHKATTGGDIVVIEPKLTVVGTTTRKLFHAALTDKALGSGTINRYLIMPGSATFEPYTGKSYEAGDNLAGIINHLTTHTFGNGKEIRTLYSEDAWEAFVAYQKQEITPLMNDPQTSEALKRLHLHLQHAAALYAWQMQSPQIEFEHFHAAYELIESSRKFLLELLAERVTNFEPTKFQAVSSAMEQRVIDKLTKTPGITRREFSRQMSKDKGGYAAWLDTLDKLTQAGVVSITRKGKREELHVSL